MKNKPSRLEITWRNGAYYVSAPNYQGGRVYVEDAVVPLMDELSYWLDFAKSYFGEMDEDELERFGNARKMVASLKGTS